MTILAIDWSSVGLKVAQLILSLSILVILHEFGHYITARWFKCRVEKFYLFFDPWFSIVKKKIGDTVYGIGWLPLGGYVKIAGMVDESMDKEQLKQPPQPWEFRSKPAWQRLIIMIGGVTVNILLAFVIYAMILFVWGEKKTLNSSLKNGIWVTDSLMHDIGLRNGDKIISINGNEVKYFEDLSPKIFLNAGGIIKVNRREKDTVINIPVDLGTKLVKGKKNKTPLFVRLPAVVGQLEKNDTSNAKKAGLQFSDKIIKVDSTPINFLDEIVTYLTDRKNQQVKFTVLRNGSEIVLPVLTNENGKTGLPILSDEQYDSMGVFKLEKKKYSFFASFPAGVRLTGSSLKSYIDQFKLIFQPSTGYYKGIGGFKAMGNIFNGNQWDWQSFWRITAFFSIVLAFMNLLPIPALDGGHVLFTLIEMITGRKPNEKFLEYAQIIGMVILFGLMLYANGNDWFGWGK